MSCTKKFPSHLIELIKTSKYVHLATASTDCIPSVSLMNYTYVPAAKTFRNGSGDDSSSSSSSTATTASNPSAKEPEDKDSDYIIFATFKNTEKYVNILANPTVSMLFHDWITANTLHYRKTSLSQTGTPTGEPNTQAKSPMTDSTPDHPSKLLNMLQQLNQAELNEMSATVRGHAIPIAQNSKESDYYKTLLLKTNPDAEVFILGDDTVIVKVKIESAKVTDSENNTNVYN